MEEEEKGLIRSVYPKPLPKRDIFFKVDKRGFTLQEIAALRNAWRILQPFQRSISVETYYSVLTEHEGFIEFFRRNGEIDLSALHRHARSMIKTIDRLIITLDREVEFRLTLESALPLHLQYNVGGEVMSIMSQGLLRQMLENPLIKKSSSSTLVNGLSRLMSLVEKYIRPSETLERMRSSVVMPMDVSLEDLEQELNHLSHSRKLRFI